MSRERPHPTPGSLCHVGALVRCQGLRPVIDTSSRKLMDPGKKTYSESWEGGKGGVNANIGGKDTPSQSCPWIKGGGCACPLTQFLMYRWCSSLPFLPLKRVFGDQWRNESALTFVSCGFAPRVTGSPVEHGIFPVCFLEPALGKTRKFLVRKEKNFMEGLVGGRTNKTAHDAGLHGPSKQPVLLNLCCSPQDEGLLPHPPAPGASSLSLAAGRQHRTLPFTQVSSWDRPFLVTQW